MADIFRIRKSEQYGAIAGLVLFLGMMLAPVVVVNEAPPDRKSYALMLLLSLEVVFGAWAAVAAWAVVACRRELLSIGAGRITYRGVLRTTVIDFAEAVDVHWRWWPAGGSIVVRALGRKITIRLDKYTPAERRALVRLVRGATPRAVQRAWEPFCQLIALPLCEATLDRPLRADESLVTRRRYDRLFPPLLALTAVASAVLSWQFRFAPPLIMPVVLAGAWLLLRFTTPVQGLRCRRASPFLLIPLIWLPLGLAAWVCYRIFENQLRSPTCCLLGGVVVWFVGLVICLVAVSTAIPSRKPLDPQSATREWERLQSAHDPA